MCVLAPLQQLTEEFLRGRLAPPALHKNVEDIPVLVDSPPEVMAYTVHRQEHLVQMPLVARPGPPMPELIRRGLAELAAPLPDGFIGDDNPTGEQEFFPIAVAQAEPEVQPDALADDLGGKLVVLGSISRRCAHEASIAYQAGTGPAAQQVDSAFPLSGSKT